MAHDTTEQASPASTCPRCGRSFVCGAVAGLERCWCMERPPLGLVPGADDKCYCPACLDALVKAAGD